MATVERMPLRDSTLCLRGGVVVAAFFLLAHAVSAFCLVLWRTVKERYIKGVI